MEDPELLVFLDPRETLVTPEPPVCPVARETAVGLEVMVLLETGESLETLVPPERVDSEVTRESLDYPETWELPENEVCPVLPEPRAMVVYLDGLVMMVPEERMAPTELLEPPELREILETTVEMLPVWTDPRERLADLD